MLPGITTEFKVWLLTIVAWRSKYQIISGKILTPAREHSGDF